MGVAVSDECKTYFEDIKKAKKYRYVVFYIKEEKSIVVESVGDRDSSYDDYLNDLQKGGDGECRYGLYDFEYEHQCQGTTESSKKQKLFLMNCALTLPRLRRRCCTPPPSTTSRKPSSECTSSSRPLMPLRRPRARWKSS